MNPLQKALGGVKASEGQKQRIRALAAARAGAKKKRWALSAAACAAMLFLALAAGGFLYLTPVTVIGVDGSPSVELLVNRFDRVVGTKSYNTEGQAALSTLSLTHMPFWEAVGLLLEGLPPEGGLAVTAVSEDAAAIQAAVEQNPVYQAFDGQFYQADRGCLADAHAQGLSVGRYRAYLELQQYGSSVTIDDCRHMTMGELQQQVKACQGHSNGASSSDASSQGNSYGHGHSYKHRYGH